VQLFPYDVRVSVNPPKERAISHFLTVKKEDTTEMEAKKTSYKFSKLLINIIIC
jgi:hypothetical protein